MTEHFTPIPFEKLLSWVLDEYKTNKAIFGIPEQLFFRPAPKDPFAFERFGYHLETPIGVAAGPHTQLSQNIIAAWLCGGRFIELKTIQELDELEVSKPCIDMYNEGYNCEWSQELRIMQSYNEYLNAWVILHILHDLLGFDNGKNQLGAIFNMSVGYNLEGIKGDKVQGFLKKMTDASEDIEGLKKVAAKYYPGAENLNIPYCISDNITLSTMHGCPPDEIEKIATYLIKEGNFHTTIKFNPTLLGPQGIRQILNDKLGFPTQVPDEAFGHDPKYEDAINIIQQVRKVALEKGVEFSFKLTNTLESVNSRDIFPAKEAMAYMSGKPLHIIDTVLADKMMHQTRGRNLITFSGGVDAFSIADIISCNIRPVTVCSDVLKPGGYSRLYHYMDEMRADMEALKAENIEEYVARLALLTETSEAIAKSVDFLFENGAPEKEKLIQWVNYLMGKLKDKNLALAAQEATEKTGWGKDLTIGNDNPPDAYSALIRACALLNINSYAQALLEEDDYYRHDFQDKRSVKGARNLGWFDCNFAPCTQECPVNQNVPDYMYFVAQGQLDKAAQVVLKDNPLPNIAGRVCDHMCQIRCVRSSYEQPLAIREMKRYIMDNGMSKLEKKKDNGKKAAIIGAGPSGLSCAYYLALNGFKVTVYEQNSVAGGMAASAIPTFRLPMEKIQKDVDLIESLGVKILYNQAIGRDITLKSLMEQGNDHIYIGVGAQTGLKLGIAGEEGQGIYDSLDFLAQIIQDPQATYGASIGIVGGGNSAIDVARSAWRLSNKPKVTLIYRRTIDEMPADREEIEGLLEEGIEIVELASPKQVILENGRITGLECMKMQLGERDSSGRRRPEIVPDSKFIIPLTALVSAISQGTVLDFVDGALDIDKKGLIITDPKTFETSKKGIYAGGDVVRGPATLIKAVGDGKKVACHILGLEPDSKNVVDKGLSRRELTIKKAQRIFSTVDTMLDVEKRQNFDEMANTMDEQMAKTEAERCLYCDQYCGLCTLVCPNRANISYEIQPFSTMAPILELENGQYKELCREKVAIEQAYQIVNVGDFCNECGNCTTFCPTMDAPYRVKPKLYLSRQSFDGHQEDGLIFEKDGDNIVMNARQGGISHRLISDSSGLKYQGCGIECTISEKYDIAHIKILDNGAQNKISLDIAVNLAAIYRGLIKSMPYLLGCFDKV